MADPPQIIDESWTHSAVKTLLVDGRARAGDILPVYHGSNMCLYSDVRFIGLPPSYTADIGDVPFNVAHYNDKVREYSQKAWIDKTGMYLCLLDGNTFESADLPTSTDFVCCYRPKDSAACVGHFCAARAIVDSREVATMGVSRETSIFTAMAEFRILFRTYAKYQFQPETTMPSNATDSWSYEVMDGAGAWRKVETSRLPCRFRTEHEEN